MIMFILSQNTASMDLSKVTTRLAHGRKGLQRISVIVRIGAQSEMFDNSGGRDNEEGITKHFVLTKTFVRLGASCLGVGLMDFRNMSFASFDPSLCQQRMSSRSLCKRGEIIRQFP